MNNLAGQRVRVLYLEERAGAEARRGERAWRGDQHKCLVEETVASTEPEKVGEPDSVEPRMPRAGLTGLGPDCLCDPHCDFGHKSCGYTEGGDWTWRP